MSKMFWMSLLITDVRIVISFEKIQVEEIVVKRSTFKTGTHTTCTLIIKFHRFGHLILKIRTHDYCSIAIFILSIKLSPPTSYTRRMKTICFNGKRTWTITKLIEEEAIKFPWIIDLIIDQFCASLGSPSLQPPARKSYINNFVLWCYLFAL